ncbi:MAG: hypothetical protein KC561_02645 [Myxococcales bacterium]|nr:hypothetical protein [Myxococcales bacterium]
MRFHFLPLTLVLALAACGEETGADPFTPNNTDTRVRGDGTDEDDVDDSEVEADADPTGDADEELHSGDLEEDVPSGDVTIVDAGPDQGIACGEQGPDAGPVCGEAWDCVNGVCTLPVAGRTYVERSYTIVEPEELRHIFDLFKTFAGDTAFLLIHFSSTEGEPDRLPARYGSADRIQLGTTGEAVYEWQYDTQDVIMFTPDRGTGGLRGEAWRSNIFQWNLQARVVNPVDDRTNEEFGFVAEQTQVYVEFTEDMSVGEGEFRGVVTRAEAESQVFDGNDFAAFRVILCREDPDLLPAGANWTLADLLDCNATPMDVDLNGDGILDGYSTVVEMEIVPAELAEE